MNIENNKLKFIEDNYYGIGGYEQTTLYSYLNKHPRESDKDYKSRRAIGSFSNYFRPLIDIYTKPVISSFIDLQTSNIKIEGLFNDTNLMTNAEKALLNLKLYEIAYYGVEYDGDELPNVIIINTPDVDTEIIKKNQLIGLEWTEYKVYKKVRVPIECEYSGNQVIRITQAWLENGNVTLTKTDDRLTIFDDIVEEATYKKLGTNTLEDKPTNYDMGLVNKDIFNKQSLIDEILYRNAFSLLVIPSDQKLKELNPGTGRALVVPSSVSKLPEYVEISSTNFDIINEDMNQKKSYLYKMFTSNLYADNIKYTTAMSSLIASRGFDNELTYLFNNYKIVANLLLNDMVRYFNIKQPYKINFEDKITYNIENVNESMSNSFGIE